MILLYFTLAAAATALSGWWVIQGLRSGEMPYDLFMRPRRDEQPVLYWLAIWAQITATAVAVVLTAIAAWWGVTHA